MPPEKWFDWGWKGLIELIVILALIILIIKAF